MDQRTAELIVEAAQDEGYVSFSVYEGYSGRAMFGKTTTAVVYPCLSALVTVVARLTRTLAREDEYDEVMKDIRTMRHDELGKEFIAY